MTEKCCLWRRATGYECGSGYWLLRYFDIPYDRGTAFIDGKPIDIGYKDRLDDKANHAWGHNKTLNAHYDWQFNDEGHRRDV